MSSLSTNAANIPGPGPGAAAGTPQDPKGVRDLLGGKAICPFCGQAKSSAGEPCPRCTMEDTPATRQATKARIGPWYVLQTRSPSAPGMKFSTLLWLVSKGHVTPKSIVRGPTTHQLWRWAAHVRGLSREFGLCYSCGGQIDKRATVCPHCERPQDPPTDPDALVEMRDGPQPPRAAASGAAANGPSRTPVMRQVEPAVLPAVPASPAAPGKAAGPPRAVRPTDGEADERTRRAAERRDEATAAPAAPARRGPDRPLDEPRVQDHELEIEREDLDDRAPSHAERALTRSITAARRTAPLRLGGREISAVALADALQQPVDAADARPHRRVSILNVLLFLLMLCVGGAALFLYVKPEYRAPTARWASQKWEAVRTQVASFRPSKSPGASSPAGMPKRDVAPASPRPQSQPPQPEPDPTATLRPPAATATTGEPSPQVNEAAAPPDSREQVAARREVPSVDGAPRQQPPQQQSQQQAQARQPAQREPDMLPREEATAARPPAPQEAHNRRGQAERQQDDRPRNDRTRSEEPAQSVEAAMDEARTLWRQGLEAEAQQDYAAAVRYYERIEKLPEAAWQGMRGALKINLTLARQRAEAAKAD